MSLRRDALLVSASSLATAAVVLLTTGSPALRPDRKSPQSHEASEPNPADETRGNPDHARRHGQPAPPNSTLRPRPAKAAPEPSTVAEAERLRALLELQDAAIKDLTQQLYGTEQTWAADTPAAYTEAGFTEAVQDILESCELEVDRTQIECSEPPCIAVLDGTKFDTNGEGFGRVQACLAWKKRYGPGSHLRTSTVTCDNGVTRRVHMISPMDPNEADDESREEKAQWQRRMTRRWADLEDEVCHRQAQRSANVGGADDLADAERTAPNHDRRERSQRIDDLRRELGLSSLRT